MHEQRLQSLDAFRGLTIAAMLIVNNPGDWGHTYAPLQHAPWDGWTLTDCIFPFFVFISGISMALSLERRALAGADKWALWGQASRRGLLIMALGLALNFIPALDPSTLRFPGVLQRLGLCTVLAAPIVLYFSWRAQLVWLVALLVAYTGVQSWVPVPDVQGVWHTGAWVAGQDTGAWLDRSLMEGHLWRTSKTWDPEGLLSTVPAVASQLAGVLAGLWLIGRSAPIEKTVWLLVTGLGLVWLGPVVGAWSMPINKALWTPAYVLLMAGWACAGLGVLYWLLDAMPVAKWRERVAIGAKPAIVLGMNALFLFALSGLVAKMLGFIKVTPGQSLKAWMVQGLAGLGLAPINTSLLFAFLFTSCFYGIAWVMWRKRWFIRV